MEAERDCADRGYSPEQVLAELERREPESAAFIRPQRQWADISMRFARCRPGHTPAPRCPPRSCCGRRSSIPTWSHVLTDDDRRTVHLKLIRDSDGRPVDALHVHGYAPREDSRIVEKAIWEQLSFDHGTALPDTLGEYSPAGAARPWPSRSCCCSGTCSRPGRDRPAPRSRAAPGPEQQVRFSAWTT